MICSSKAHSFRFSEQIMSGKRGRATRGIGDEWDTGEKRRGTDPLVTRPISVRTEWELLPSLPGPARRLLSVPTEREPTTGEAIKSSYNR